MYRLSLAILLFLFIYEIQSYTVLTEYVRAPDDFYKYNVSANVYKGDGYTGYNLYMISQKWLTKDETSINIWRHWIQLCIPDDLKDSDLGFIYIDGGRDKTFEQDPGDVNYEVKRVCTTSGVIGAGLYQIPNQPAYFAGDPTRGRTEDAMIAYTWSHYINNTQEYDWLARMPMTKATIKAMDAIQDFVGGLPDVKNITRFGIAGASKRGWTAWMAGCMDDPRVVGIIPIVAPISNLVPQLNEMWESYGNWSFALQDYIDMNIIGFLNRPVFQQMLDIIDPISYPEEMKKTPKYAIVAAGDEFFMPDSARYYWDKIEGEKHLRVVPNAEHSLVGSVNNVLDSCTQFLLSFLNNVERPTYSWDITNNGQTITVNTTTTNLIPDSVKVWYSRNNKRRDWRLIRCIEPQLDCINPEFFSGEILEESEPGIFSYTLQEPEEGKYSAFLIELQFDFKGESPFKVTTDMSIIPQTMPYDHCADDICNCGYDCATNYYKDPEYYYN